VNRLFPSFCCIAVLSCVVACADEDASVTLIDAGSAHSCSVLADGRVACWGANGRGQLGDESKDGRAEPVEVAELENVEAVAVGRGHSCARDEDGDAWCWGSNRFGQLGDGTNRSRTQPVRVRGVSGVVQISAGDAHSCAVIDDGSVRCWGRNISGQLGDGTTIDRVLPIPVYRLNGVTEVHAGMGVEDVTHTCALRRDGSVWCWGGNVVGQLGEEGERQSNVPLPVRGLRDVKALSVGTFHTCVITAEELLSCWGAVAAEPLQAMSTTEVIAVAAGSLHTCAIVTDGTVRCFGDNFSGQLGSERPDAHSGVAKVQDLSGVTSLSAGALHSCATLGDGSARCWGENNNGRLGDGSVGGIRFAPVTVGALSE